MVDWPGLFKWSVMYHDGTTNKNITPMDDERKKWLQEAMEEYSFDEIKKMKGIVSTLQKEEAKTPEDANERENALLELEDLVEGLSNARDLHAIDGFSVLINTMLNSSYDRVRNQAYIVFASCCQNNTDVQLIATELGAPLLLNSILSEQTKRNQEGAITALSSKLYNLAAYLIKCEGYLRGENLKGKRRFIDWQGVEYLLKLLGDKDKYSLKLYSKVLFLLQDLIYYDDKLHYKDMVSFTKASGDVPAMTYNDKKDKKDGAGLISLNKDKKEENTQDSSSKQEEQKVDAQPEQKNGEEKDILSYKDTVKKTLIEKEFYKLIESYLTTDNLKEKLTLRSAALSIIDTLIAYDKSKLEKSLVDALKALKAELVSKNKEHEDIYDIDIELLNNILKTQE